MAEYIDRQAAIKAVCDLPTWYGDAGCLPFGDPQPPMEALMYPEDVVSAINNLPSADVVPVVRCKDCAVLQICRFAQGLGLNGYCSQGERMDGEEHEL